MTNKHWITFSLFLIWLSLGIGTHDLNAFHGFEINYRVKGVDHTLNEGITNLEFNEILLSTNHDLKIEKFRITLSRGNRAVKTMDVNGNRFDLRKFTGVVRSGDYIVIEIKKFSDKMDDDRAYFKAIKVK